MNVNLQERKRCAIYTRKSTDVGLEKEFNTLESQFEFCKEYIEDRVEKGLTLVPAHYDDGGFSAKNMKRPAMQRLIQDIKLGLIDCVVTYRQDRISREPADYYAFMQFLRQHNVDIVFVTQTYILWPK